MTASTTPTSPQPDAPREVILPAEAGNRDLAAYWASRALLGDYGPLCDEDREMADAAYARAMDVQLGIAGKGTHKTLRECFPIGDVTRREDEERDAAEATPEDGALLALREVTSSTEEGSSR